MIVAKASRRREPRISTRPSDVRPGRVPVPAGGHGAGHGAGREQGPRGSSSPDGSSKNAHPHGPPGCLNFPGGHVSGALLLCNGRGRLTLSQSRSQDTSGLGSPTTSHTMTTLSPSSTSKERGLRMKAGSLEYLLQHVGVEHNTIQSGKGMDVSGCRYSSRHVSYFWPQKKDSEIIIDTEQSRHVLTM